MSQVLGDGVDVWDCPDVANQCKQTHLTIYDLGAAGIHQRDTKEEANKKDLSNLEAFLKISQKKGFRYDCGENKKGAFLMKIGSLVVAVLGILALIVGLVLKVTGHAHGLTTLGIGAVLLILGLVGAFVLAPKK